MRWSVCQWWYVMLLWAVIALGLGPGAGQMINCLAVLARGATVCVEFWGCW